MAQKLNQIDGIAAQAAGGSKDPRGSRIKDSKYGKGKQEDLDQKFEMLLELDLIDVGDNYYKEEILFSEPE